MEKKTPVTNERESDVAEGLSRSVEAFGRTLDRLSDDRDRAEQRYLELNSRLEAANIRLRQSLDSNRDEIEYLRSVVEHCDCGVIAVDHTGRVRVYNQAAERMLGCKSADVVGRPYEDVWPDCLTDSA